MGPVVISGFNGTNPNNYKDTDLEIVIGPQSSLPARYAKGSQWGRTWPNNIDPCVFYDEQGKLWMSYGSWSGGIFMIELDETTGLRDYDDVQLAVTSLLAKAMRFTSLSTTLPSLKGIILFTT